MRKISRQVKAFFMVLGLGLLSTACAVPGKTTRPEAEVKKPEPAGVLDLSIESPDWIRLSPVPSPGAAALPDTSFQSRKTAAIISLSSSCGMTGLQDIRKFNDSLFARLTKVRAREEQTLLLAQSEALQTTARALHHKRDFKLRKIVLKKLDCFYDLTYLARPARFAENEQDFSRFVASLRLP